MFKTSSTDMKVALISAALYSKRETDLALQSVRGYGLVLMCR